MDVVNALTNDNDEEEEQAHTSPEESAKSDQEEQTSPEESAKSDQEEQTSPEESAKSDQKSKRHQRKVLSQTKSKATVNKKHSISLPRCSLGLQSLKTVSNQLLPKDR